MKNGEERIKVNLKRVGIDFEIEDPDEHSPPLQPPEEVEDWWTNED